MKPQEVVGGTSTAIVGIQKSSGKEDLQGGYKSNQQVLGIKMTLEPRSTNSQLVLPSKLAGSSAHEELGTFILLLVELDALRKLSIPSPIGLDCMTYDRDFVDILEKACKVPKDTTAPSHKRPLTILRDLGGLGQD